MYVPGIAALASVGKEAIEKGTSRLTYERMAEKDRKSFQTWATCKRQSISHRRTWYPNVGEVSAM